jgi:probable rRNA maturation factor
VDYAEGIAGQESGFSFALLSDARMRELHASFSGVDSTTDVLAFPLREEPFLEGAVAISVDTARRDAARRGHAPYHEVMLYAVHGVLHLLGHDDHAPRARAEMRRAERRALRALGLPPVFGRRSGRRHA